MDETMKQQNTDYTLASWLDEWLVTYKQCSVRKKTYENYQYAVSLIEKQPEAHELLVDLTELELQRILNKLYKDEYSKSTIRVVRLTLRQSYRIAQRLHFIENNPCDVLVLPKAAVKKIVPLTHEEQALVEKECKNDRLGHLFIFLLKTGLRRTEMMNLKWDDYNSITQEIKITKSKTDAGIRTVPLISEAQKIIESQPHINEYIFNSTRKTPLTNTVMKRLYERLRKKTGIKKLTNHVCRHTFVTRMCEKGVSPKSIAQIIGHAKTDYVMDIYALIEKRELRYAIYKLEDNYEINDNEHTVHLPTVLYNIAVNGAEVSGMTVDTFITRTILNSLNMGVGIATKAK